MRRVSEFMTPDLRARKLLTRENFFPASAHSRADGYFGRAKAMSWSPALVRDLACPPAAMTTYWRPCQT